MLKAIQRDGDLEVRLGERPFLFRPELVISARGSALREGFGDLSAFPWENAGRIWRRRYELSGEPLGEMRFIHWERAILVEFEFLRDVDFLGAEDSFVTPSLLAPAFRFPKDMDFALLTFGLGGREERYPGGYWPEFRWGKGPEELPREAFAPLLLWGDEGTVAVAPANYHLTSPLVRFEGGFGRGLHGAVRILPRGFTLSTWIAAGDDPYAALRELGSLLSPHPSPITHHPLFDSLGWWNAYGSYYTEVLHPLDEGALRELAVAFKGRDFPLGYFGLDLWYRFKSIGKAIRYQPDPAKYPSGLRRLREETGFPYVLHLSALSEENEYGVAPGDPEVYREIAAELEHHGAVAAWHDWLRTQQFLERRLRGEPGAAEQWFSGMVEAFAERGLPVLLCMQTMGMILASLKHPNVVSARSFTDYLFILEPALREAARRGHPDMLEGRVDHLSFRLQNLLVGSVYWTLGIRPFFDLFLTRENPVV
ncbi:TPA: hypothetical protein EYP13_02455, partial [Candidatus Micrarchaeota archaeon]|nr:hypothetical protein [Candidatus Micrarchaeota archaeon]